MINGNPQTYQAKNVKLQFELDSWVAFRQVKIEFFVEKLFKLVSTG